MLRSGRCWAYTRAPPVHNMQGREDCLEAGSKKNRPRIKRRYMYKPDFEKNVQQQMQELRFHPSDEVWKRVEAEIVPAKRRRPLLFFLIFIGLLLGGGLYFIFSNRPVGNRPYNASQVLKEPVSRSPDNKSVIPGTRKVPNENKINANPKKGKPLNTVGPHLFAARHDTD